MTLTADKVTACLVTRGDQPDAVSRIREMLIFPNVRVWDNSVEEKDWKVAGRYEAARRAYLDGLSDVIYLQDDDVLVPPETQQALLDAWEPGVCVANWGHGDEPAGFDDLPLVCAGAIVEWDMMRDALWRYLDVWPCDDGFLYEADFIAGVLYPNVKHLHLPHQVLHDVAQHPSRLVNQPWQRSLKLEITNRARRIRDNDPDATYPDWYLENWGEAA